MDNKLIPPILKKRDYIVICIACLLLILGICNIRQRLIEKTNNNTSELITSQVNGYRLFINEKFSSYEKTLKIIDENATIENTSANELQQIIDNFQKADSSIISIFIPETINRSSIYSGRNPNLIIKSKPIENASIIDNNFLIVKHTNNTPSAFLILDLSRLHQQFILDNIYTDIFQIIIDQNGNCIYHPDKTNIGKSFPLPAFQKLDSIPASKNTYFKKGYSSYLKLPVYKVYSDLTFINQKWTLLSILPGFEIEDIASRQEKTLSWIFILFMSFISVLVIYEIIRWKKEVEIRTTVEKQNLKLKIKQEQQSKETIRLRHEILKSSLNSHFLFNTLGNIKALLFNENKIASTAIANLSTLYRYLLNTEGQHLISLKEELKFTNIYIDILKMRFQNTFKIIYRLTDNELHFQTVPVSLQLLIENSIKHNKATKSLPLYIYIYIKDNYLVVKNEIRPKQIITQNTQKGLKNLKARYAMVTTRKCVFEKNDSYFIAYLPLLKMTKQDSKTLEKY